MSNRLQLSALIALLAVFLLGACTIAPPAETEREEIITVDSPGHMGRFLIFEGVS